MLRWVLAIGLVAALAGWLGYGVHAAAIESATMPIACMVDPRRTAYARTSVSSGD